MAGFPPWHVFHLGILFLQLYNPQIQVKECKEKPEDLVLVQSVIIMSKVHKTPAGLIFNTCADCDVREDHDELSDISDYTEFTWFLCSHSGHKEYLTDIRWRKPVCSSLFCLSWFSNLLHGKELLTQGVYILCNYHMQMIQIT